MKQITFEVKHFQIGGKEKQLMRLEDDSSQYLQRHLLPIFPLSSVFPLATLLLACTPVLSILFVLANR